MLHGVNFNRLESVHEELSDAFDGSSRSREMLSVATGTSRLMSISEFVQKVTVVESVGTNVKSITKTSGL